MTTTASRATCMSSPRGTRVLSLARQTTPVGSFGRTRHNDRRRCPMGFRTTDLLDAHPELEACAAGLTHFGGLRRFSGRAVTLRCAEDNSLLRELVRTAGAGRVFVVDGGG